MTPPPSKPSDDRALTREAAAALNAAAARRLGSEGAAPIAIVAGDGEAVSVTAFGLAAIGATDRADFQTKFLSGEGPAARRLRRLAATLSPEAPPRLERLPRLGFSTSINVRCVRVAAGDGATFLVLAADERAPSAPRAAIGAARRATAPVAHADAGARTRFLWSLDKDGRFGDLDAALVGALGAAAPAPGEPIEAVSRRAHIANADALIEATGRRETFSGLRILWRTEATGAALPVTLSAAPLFDHARAFAGFRGFGSLGGAIATALAPPADAEPDEVPAEDRGENFDAAAPGPAAPADAEPTHVASAAATIEPAEPEAAGAPQGEPQAAAPSQGPNEPQAAAPPEEATAPETPVAPVETPPAQERSAEIFVLRQGHSAPAKIVPIRPGAFDALKASESETAGDDSVELTNAEREAFREIARALVGRAPARQERPPGETDPPANADPAAPSERPPRGADAGQPAPRDALTLLDRLPIGVLVARDAEPLYVNQPLLSLLGYRDLDHFAASDGLAAMFPAYGRPAPRGHDSAFAIVAADGSALQVEGRAQAIDWDGAPATLLMLRKAEGLRAGDPGASGSETQADAAADGVAGDLSEMLALAADGAVVLDAVGRIQAFNASAERLFGYPAREVTGESVLMLLAPPSHPAATAELDSRSRANDGSPMAPPLPVVGRTRDGAPLDLALTLARIGAVDTPHFCALFRDMRRERETERRLAAARDAALAASAAKTELLAHVSHEIRTPLHAILGFAEVMMEERFGPIGNDRYRDYLKDIHASGRHVMSLADDLLDLSKIESGKLELAFTPVDANSLIRDCVSLMQPQAARERIIMRVSLYDRLPKVMVDERSLKQIMLNLMSNAVKFNEPGGQVIVSTALDAAGQAIIRVRDTGVGMNENEVGVALEPFGQVGRGGRKGGVGLGLPLTKALVEANGAEFSIKS